MHEIDLSFCHVGSIFTIEAGTWRSFMCNENTTLLEFTHCHPLEALKALYCMSYIFIDRVWTNGLGYAFPKGPLSH
jgi:hypothetical protein